MTEPGDPVGEQEESFDWEDFDDDFDDDFEEETEEEIAELEAEHEGDFTAPPTEFSRDTSQSDELNGNQASDN